MEKRDTLINNLTEGPLKKQLLLFSVPLVLGNLMHTMYNLVDMAIVGQFVGSAGLSAVSTSGTITMLLYGLGIGLGTGGQILISQQVGARDEKGINTTIGTYFTFTVILAVAVTLLGIFLREPLLRMLNTPAEAWEEAVEYFFWCCMGIPFTYLNGGMSALLRGMGESKQPTVFITAAALSNIVLDLLFVAVLGMRAKGAAMATSIAQFIGCVWCLVFLYRNHTRFGFVMKAESFRMERKTLFTIIKLAAPAAVQTMVINISMLFVNAWVNAFGVVASAVSGVGSKLYSLFSIITHAMQSAVATFTGQNIAAGRHDRVRGTMYASTVYSMVFWLLSVGVCVFLPRQLFSLFTQEAAVLDMAQEYMFIQIFMYLGFALMNEPLGLITGVGHVNLNLAIAIADGVVARIGLSLLLGVGFGMGLHGYWWGQALAGFVSCIWGWVYFFSGRWENRKLVMQ